MFSSELKFSFTTTRLFRLKQFAIYIQYASSCYYNTGGVYTSDISATDADGFYNTITYSLDNDYDGVFTINRMTGDLRRTTNTSIPAPAAVSSYIAISMHENRYTGHKQFSRCSTLQACLLSDHWLKCASCIGPVEC